MRNIADLCVIGDVQAWTQVTYSGSTAPTSTQVSAWITAITSYIEELTGRKFTETTVTGEKHSGSGTNIILTKRYPVSSVTSLVVDGVTLVENTDFWIREPRCGAIETLQEPEKAIDGIDGGRNNITITYKHYDTEIPASLAELCAVIVAMKAQTAALMATSSQGAVKSYSDGDVSISYADGDKLAGALIARYEELKNIVPRRLHIEIGGV